MEEEVWTHAVWPEVQLGQTQFSIVTNATCRTRRRVESGGRQGVQPCKFDQSCRRGRLCHFTHSRSRTVAPVDGERIQVKH